MRGGDISNESPPRLYVVLDAVGEDNSHEDRKLLRKTFTLDVKWNLRELNHVWNLRDRLGLVTTLLIYGDRPGNLYFDNLEERGINPFNYVETYPDVETFVADTPYFFNVVGVVDRPERVGRYGSLGLELDNL